MRVERASRGDCFCGVAKDEALHCERPALPLFTVKKIKCSKQAFVMNILAWNNRIGLCSILLVCWIKVMIKRDSWGHLYYGARGEILRLP